MVVLLFLFHTLCRRPTITVRSLGYPEENIYVVYLIRDENKYPDDESWISEKNYKESFAPRFHILSYRNDILPWLSKAILPICDDNNMALRAL